MASVYTNDLRLEEIGSGEQSGTWGDTTNTNLELIAEGFSFGTEAITTNADTHTSTVADGATDPARSMYIKYTGTLDSTCTITIAPNTLSRVHFIENGTSGDQDIIISQGSGANVTIPPGDVKAVYLDGAGSGAAVTDAFASLNVGSFTSEGASTITTADNSDTLTLKSTDADASVGPNLNLYRNSSSPADNDIAGRIQFNSRNDNSQDVTYSELYITTPDVSDGTEDGQLHIDTMVAGTSRSRVKLTPSETVFNENSIDLDFRVESNGIENMLFVDGDEDKVFIGHNTTHQYDAYGAEIIMQIEAAGTAPYAGIGMIQNSNDSDPAPLIFGKSRGNSLGSTTIVQDGDLLGRIEFQGMDGGDLETAASIFGVVDGTPGANDMPGRLIFNTTADGANSASERMRIDNSGGVSIGSGANAVGIHSLAKVLEISGGDGGDLILGNSVSTNIGSGAHIGALAFKNIDNSLGVAPNYAGIRCESEDTSGNMDLRFYTGTTKLESDEPRMTINSGGAVMIGEINEVTNGADLNVTMVSEDTGFSLACRSATDGHTPYITFQKTPATSGNYTATGVDDFIGLINFKGVNTSAVANEAARIQVIQSATSSSSVPAIMKIEVGAISNCLQIAPNSTSGVAIGMGTTAVSRRCDIRSTNITTLGVFYQDLSDVSMMQMGHSRATGGNNATMIQFQNAAGVEKGTIKTTTSATSYNTSSDYRLKENVSYDWDGTTRLKQLKPARFNWIEDETNTLVDGFLAHEASGAVPESVFNDKDETKTVTNAVLNSHGNVIEENITEADWIAGKTEKTDSEGNKIEPTYASDTSWVASKVVPVYQQIDHSKLVPLLVKTIQELEARITALEA